MPPSARLTSTALDHGKVMIKAGTDRLTSVVRNHKKSLVYVGAALALAGAGSASAATVAGTGTTPLAGGPVRAPVSTGSVAHAAPSALATPHSASPSPALHAVAQATGQAPAASSLVTGSGPAQRAAVRPSASAKTTAKPSPFQRAVAGQPRQANAAHQPSGKGGVAAAAKLQHTQPVRPAKPYLFYDSVEPGAIPPHHLVATYATGGYAVPASAVAGRQVMWIDARGTDPLGASALDIEPGDATPTIAANWARAKLTADPHAIAHLYTMISEWPAVRAAVATLPHQMQTHIRWWIADPTGVPHLVPGSDATQWYWGSHYDISTALPRF
jgi:hypothetical protein